MKKIFFATLAFVFVVFTAFNVLAAVQINSVSTAAGIPGDTLPLNANVTNTDLTSSVNVVFNSTILTGPSGFTINAPSINPATIPANTTQLVFFTINIPSVLTGDYSGTLTAIGPNTVTKQYIITVNSKDALDVLETSLSLKEQPGEQASGTITIMNAGSSNLNFVSSSFSFNGADFSDGTENIT
ncbi:MAG: hypothetical protein AABX59_03855, partial [Nanoarchaeota archaeon]